MVCYSRFNSYEQCIKNSISISGTRVASRRYIPQILQEIGVEITDDICLSNGHEFSALYEQLPVPNYKIRSAMERFATRFGFDHTQKFHIQVIALQFFSRRTAEVTDG